MKSRKLSAILECRSDKRQKSINDICKAVDQKLEQDAGAEETLYTFAEYLKEEYDISRMTLEELNVYKSKIESLTNSILASHPSTQELGQDGANVAHFFTSLDCIVKEEIEQKQPLHLEQCKKICNDYLTSLEKDLHGASTDTEDSASEFEELTRQKHRIVTKAVQKLNNPDQELGFEEKIASFQKVLTDPKNAKILAKNRNSFAKEAAMQIGSLFLVNLYRMIAGTKGANLINILGIQNKQMSMKERLLGIYQAQAGKKEETPEPSSPKK